LLEGIAADPEEPWASTARDQARRVRERSALPTPGPLADAAAWAALFLRFPPTSNETTRARVRQWRARPELHAATLRAIEADDPSLERLSPVLQEVVALGVAACFHAPEPSFLDGLFGRDPVAALLERWLASPLGETVAVVLLAAEDSPLRARILPRIRARLSFERRRALARSLRSRPPREREALSAWLLEDGDPEVRREGVRHGHHAHARLVALVSADPEPEVRREAARRLADSTRAASAEHTTRVLETLRAHARREPEERLLDAVVVLARAHASRLSLEPRQPLDEATRALSVSVAASTPPAAARDVTTLETLALAARRVVRAAASAEEATRTLVPFLHHANADAYAPLLGLASLPPVPVLVELLTESRRRGSERQDAEALEERFRLRLLRALGAPLEGERLVLDGVRVWLDDPSETVRIEVLRRASKHATPDQWETLRKERGLETPDVGALLRDLAPSTSPRES
ncbi:MAG: hypothetical protein KC586_26610, partial [Myxococcales bacterium]|nr:hypothetical protein [Myxococcales bacterium]